MEGPKYVFVNIIKEEVDIVKNPMVYYAAIALGVIAAVAGVVMKFAMNYHGKAYVAIAVGAVLIIAGIVGMVIMKPSSSTPAAAK